MLYAYGSLIDDIIILISIKIACLEIYSKFGNDKFGNHKFGNDKFGNDNFGNDKFGNCIIMKLCFLYFIVCKRYCKVRFSSCGFLSWHLYCHLVHILYS